MEQALVFSSTEIARNEIEASEWATFLSLLLDMMLSWEPNIINRLKKTSIVL